MITIITETEKEYDDVLEFAKNYVCRRNDYHYCQENICFTCYENNHLRCGIRVVRVDNESPDLL